MRPGLGSFLHAPENTDSFRAALKRPVKAVHTAWAAQDWAMLDLRREVLGDTLTALLQIRKTADALVPDPRQLLSTIGLVGNYDTISNLVTTVTGSPAAAFQPLGTFGSVIRSFVDGDAAAARTYASQMNPTNPDADWVSLMLALVDGDTTTARDRAVAVSGGQSDNLATANGLLTLVYRAGHHHYGAHMPNEFSVLPAPSADERFTPINHYRHPVAVHALKKVQYDFAERPLWHEAKEYIGTGLTDLAMTDSAIEYMWRVAATSWALGDYETMLRAGILQDTLLAATLSNRVEYPHHIGFTTLSRMCVSPGDTSANAVASLADSVGHEGYRMAELPGERQFHMHMFNAVTAFLCGDCKMAVDSCDLLDYTLPKDSAYHGTSDVIRALCDSNDNGSVAALDHALDHFAKICTAAEGSYDPTFALVHKPLTLLIRHSPSLPEGVATYRSPYLIPATDNLWTTIDHSHTAQLAMA